MLGLLLRHKSNTMSRILFFITLLIFTSCKKEEFNPELIREFTVSSSITGTTYPIKVALPEDFSASKKYPTLYILDGEENFDFVAGECKKIADDNGFENILVVSIGYGNDRKVDYTPTPAEEGDGGANAFLLFIQNDLIPHMENNFHADTDRKSRILMGHSFGGLCAAYAFTNFNNVFENYLMLSPSLWYDNEIMLRLEDQNRFSNNQRKQLVYMGIGQLENSGRMQAPFEAFYQRLQNNYNHISISKYIVPNLDHVGSKNKNIETGLRFYFVNRSLN